MNIAHLINQAHDVNASDIHIVCGLPVKFRVGGKLISATEETLTREEEFRLRALLAAL